MIRKKRNVPRITELIMQQHYGRRNYPKIINNNHPNTMNNQPTQDINNNNSNFIMNAKNDDHHQGTCIRCHKPKILC